MHSLVGAGRDEVMKGNKKIESTSFSGSYILSHCSVPGINGQSESYANIPDLDVDTVSFQPTTGLFQVHLCLICVGFCSYSTSETKQDHLNGWKMKPELFLINTVHTFCEF